MIVGTGTNLQILKVVRNPQKGTRRSMLYYGGKSKHNAA